MCVATTRPRDPAQAQGLPGPEQLEQHEEAERRPAEHPQHHAQDHRRRAGQVRCIIQCAYYVHIICISMVYTMYIQCTYNVHIFCVYNVFTRCIQCALQCACLWCILFYHMAGRSDTHEQLHYEQTCQSTRVLSVSVSLLRPSSHA